MRRDSYGLAYNLTRRAAEVKPDNAAAWHNMGKCYHERQKDAEADEHFRRAVKMKADFPNALGGSVDVRPPPCGLQYVYRPR
jgi:Flp pilus assembly protein TadD